MKVTVSKYLNVRVGKPCVNAPNYQYLAPGSELEVDGKLYEGDPYDGNTSWYKDEAGNYYWSGGVKDNGIVSTELNLSDFWFEKLEISHIWNNYNEQGDKCNVLILDTGINDNLDVFKGALSEVPFNFVVNSNTTKSIDKQSHGTHCAGLIASRPIKFKVGAAPQAKLVVAKTNELGTLKNADTINSALTEFLKPKYDNKIDVISISQTLPLPNNKLNELIKSHLDKNRVVLAAIGNDSFKNNLNTENYPGFLKEVISVGACESNNNISKYTCYPSAVDIFCYGTDIKSYTEEKYPIPQTGTSQATAIVAGICALVISFLKKKNMPISGQIIKELLKNNSIPLESNSQYKLIQPKSIFEFIKLST